MSEVSFLFMGLSLFRQSLNRNDSVAELMGRHLIPLRRPLKRNDSVAKVMGKQFSIISSFR